MGFYRTVRKYKGITSVNVARAMLMISTLPPDKTIYESDELYSFLSDNRISNKTN